MQHTKSHTTPVVRARTSGLEIRAASKRVYVCVCVCARERVRERETRLTPEEPVGPRFQISRTCCLSLTHTHTPTKYSPKEIIRKMAGFARATKGVCKRNPCARNVVVRHHIFVPYLHTQVFDPREIGELCVGG